MSILNSVLGFGTYRITTKEAMLPVLQKVVSLGYDFIDTAKHYENETIIGECLQIIAANPVYQNNKLPLIQSKIWPSDYKNSVEQELRATLARLQIDQIDSFLLHRPHVDMSVNVQAWKELIACQQKGLVAVIGVSNFDRDQVQTLFNETQVMPQINQIESSVTYMRYDRIIYNKRNNISVQGWRPFGNYTYTFQNVILQSLAQKYQCTVAQLMLAYNINQSIIPVCRTSVIHEIEENIIAKKIFITPRDLSLVEMHLNTHLPSTHNGCDSFANLSLDEDWYKNH
ncbi:2,5-diketo-D-gluconate reductase A [Mycoplasmoides fastidiosum]|uniref:2,5-diketo-D-gluconate reductase A n=1 Tax=Mycoplasmoides fastidiosum TaxID=92758 RepID=A0ABU0LYZ8_9BACT|nr:aldo/keto reductase [Mycoplasmoides fastidiosum]MDQ0513914.1 2,5-diketo-D-gluconate reductase A [Mycoplasmoides fastidiosum]UUD37672.1 aldo/keto reductase [Mycoplasmoides fastidiosum]